jgi:UDP-N-acetyl-D-mannosaminuronate dehydrogenase
MRPILERGGLRSGHEFFLAYSPEHDDPGNDAFRTTNFPKVVGSDGDLAFTLRSSTEATVELSEAVGGTAVGGRVGW